MREVFVASLVADVLGPRNGVREIMTEGPLGEYITGVLAPVDQHADLDPDSQLELPTEDFAEETEETEGADDADVGVEGAHDVAPFAPVLDPQRRPSALGLSFVVTAPDGAAAPGTLDLCLTWARYVPGDEGHGVRWTRHPRAVVLAGVPLAPGMWLLGPTGPLAPGRGPSTVGNGGAAAAGGAGTAAASPAEVSVHVIVRSLTPGRTMITVHLVNRLRPPPDESPDAAFHIFQPQVRVRAGAGVAVVPGLGVAPASEEERVLQFLHRSRPVLARGHLCSAVWRDVDPEAAGPPPAVGAAPAAAATPPFVWGDGELLGPADRLRFTAPDVRSEYVPLVAVPSPELVLPAGYAPGAQLGADHLAECWSGPAMRAALSPILAGYRRWIWEGWQASRTLTTTEREIARALLGDCRATAKRIRAGVDLLVRDDDARLAFCFAMRAMALQATWPAGDGPPRTLTWRPFQLAFMLTALESIADPSSPDRDVCDLLWVPTGGGKTEAYLALMAFTMALRRRRAAAVRRVPGAASRGATGAGVAVLSRYTLRLLSLQQFRRTLKLVTACEVLRVHGLGAVDAAGRRLPVGWRPAACTLGNDFLWGSPRFSAGLWVGSGVAPNRLQDSWANNRSIPGALTMLASGGGNGEPAQVVRCPACDSVLAVPQDGTEQIPAGGYVLRWTVRGAVPKPRALVGRQVDGLTVTRAQYDPLPDGVHGTLNVLLGGRGDVTADLVDRLWADLAPTLPGVALACARASRPGYVLRRYDGSQRPFDFDVVCPAARCPLHVPWCEGVPAGQVQGVRAQATGPAGGVGVVPALPEGGRLVHACAPFRDASPFVSDRVPVPAYTVDDQVYHRCPTVVIATVDKFARPAFEPRAAALFGNVDRHHCAYGFYREGLHPYGQAAGAPHPSPAGRREGDTWISVQPFDPPDLIVQDELHLIEGPLGSLVGLYETAVDALSRDARGRPVKYVASSATVRQAREQVQAVFGRRLATFPPPGTSADDSFFVRFPRPHPLEDRAPGRLYAGIAAPGRGPLTPLLRLWARLLQTAHAHAADPAVDPFWTLTGYFNAIRELAGARALYRQDIPERLVLLSRLDGGVTPPRPLPEDTAQELSGRMESTQLPVVLDLLNAPQGQTALFTTSMFGTGVDVPRLGLMVVNGQPKSTSAYIQATGRVGRQSGALVVTFLRATRPRDLNHYEYFCGYHVQLHRFVEPVTVMPFAPGARDRGLGPVGVFLLRNGRGLAGAWSPDGFAVNMARMRGSAEVTALPPALEVRAADQPPARRPPVGAVLTEVQSALDDWQAVAGRHRTSLRYVEYSDTPSMPVVLGDAQHQHGGFEVVYENAPQSLRDIEETCGFQTS